MDITLRALVCVLFLGLGALLLIAPGIVAGALERFYSRYPLVRLAPEGQLRSKTSYIRALGLVIALVGVAVILL